MREFGLQGIAYQEVFGPGGIVCSGFDEGLIGKIDSYSSRRNGDCEDWSFASCAVHGVAAVVRERARFLPAGNHCG